MGHFVASPSAVWRLIPCPASAQMAMMFPDSDTDEGGETAAEGTAAHELSATMIHAAARANIGFPTVEETVGKSATNGVAFTDEMYEGAAMYAADVLQVMRETGVFGGPNWRCEQTLPIPRIHPQQFGTPDMSLFSEQSGTLYVWDYKFGFRIVEAFENWQGINYVAGLIDEICSRYPNMNPGEVDQRIRVVIRIVQPRAFHRDGPIREWVVRASDLRGHINTIASAVAEAVGPNPRSRAGEHCYKCAGRHACETLKREIYRGADIVGNATPEMMTPEQVAVELRFLQRLKKMVDAREDGVAAHTKALLARGDSVPWFRLEQGKGREAWAKSLDEVFLLGDLMGKNLRKTAAITPKQARDLGIDGAVISAYSHFPERGLKLVPDNGNKAKQVFSK